MLKLEEYNLKKAELEMANPIVMVVDDEKEVADAVSEIIMNSGKYEVITAYSAKEALEKLNKNKPILGKNCIRCIILDIKMPEMDGLQFLRKIRKEYSEKIGVIILSAYEDEEKWKKAMEGKVAGYIHKPFRQEDLLGTLDEFFKNEDYLVQQAGIKLYGKGLGASLKKDFDPQRIKEEFDKEGQPEPK